MSPSSSSTWQQVTALEGRAASTTTFSGMSATAPTSLPLVRRCGFAGSGERAIAISSPAFILPRDVVATNGGLRRACSPGFPAADDEDHRSRATASLPCSGGGRLWCRSFAQPKMSSSCRSASPFSSASSRTNLHYEPAIYCHCGLNAPLCHSRDSGQKFFGCQRYKDGGCGFFVWKEDILAIVEVLNDGSTQSVHELKSLILELKDEIKHLRRELEVQSVERKNLKKNLGVCYPNSYRNLLIE
nr:DNA topoisomerase [Ipomoea batatas]